jgi:gas vesicle protein
MLFKILFIISFISAYGFRNKRQLYKTHIYDKYDTNFNVPDNDFLGSEFDLEMSDEEKKLHKDIKKEEKKLHKDIKKEEKKLHKEIKTEEERTQYINDVMILQKYQTMYKLLKYLIDNKLNNYDKINLLNIFKNKIDNIIL